MESKATRAKPKSNGIGQLSLVEHALCPLDARKSLGKNTVFDTGYFYSNKQRQRRRADVQVFCPLGLSPKDEFYLWGLLALTLANPDYGDELFATRYYILRQLGVIGSSSKGGRLFTELAAALDRLSVVSYRNSAFYDPVRAEHRKVSFGFFSYSIPGDEKSNRAWRIKWDPVFIELVKPIGGNLRFNLELYSRLDPATRRLFLFLSKIFVRCKTTPKLELNHLATEILGYSDSQSRRQLKQKVTRSIQKLSRFGVLAEDSKQVFEEYNNRILIKLYRGPKFDALTSVPANIESPLVEILEKVGLDARTVRYTIKKYPSKLVSTWADITLAAKERFGMRFFHKSPTAFLLDNLKHASANQRTAPDWWHEIRKEEAKRQAKKDRQRRKEKLGKAPGPEHISACLQGISDTVFAKTNVND